MAPRKRSNILTEAELVQEPESSSKKQKKTKKDDPKEEKKPKGKNLKKQNNKSSTEAKSQLSSPVKNKTKVKQSLKIKNVNKPEIEKVEEQSISINDMNVEQLLALGEKSSGVDFSRCEVDSEDFSDSDMSDFEEVQSADIREPVIPKEDINITLQAPNLYGKNKKKNLDLEAHIRRQMNRVRKDLQLLMHKVHVLCWIAHLRFLNTTLNNPNLMATCVTLVKSKNLYPSKYSDLTYLEGILKWFHKNFELKKENPDSLCTGGLYKELEYQIEKKVAFTSRDFVLIFIILLRVLGLKARIILSFQVLPVKPSLLELYGDVIEARSEKLKKSKEAKISKEKTKSEKSVALEKEDESCQKSTKRRSSDELTNVKKKAKSRTETKDKRSDDELESEHFKPLINSSKKNVKSNSKGVHLKTSSVRSGKSKTQVDEMKNNLSSDEDEDEGHDFTLASLRKKSIKKKTGKKSDMANEESQMKKEGTDVWTEIYLEAEEKWISVDVPRQKIHCIAELYSRATHPVVYVIGCNNDHTMKDVTKRYVPNWHSDTRKKRVNEEWWNETISPYLPAKTPQDKEEDEDINRQLLDKPLPSSISEFKDHPLYALKRHLLKFEAIYPPDAPTLGFIRGEPVYARECVHVLHSREMWYKQARLVRLKEEPYKTVKARPKYDKMTGEMKRDLPLELFGKWQTEDYIPPIATGGKVPRNEYGNVDLFKPCMLPIGTVHLQIPGLIRVAKKLDIDCAPATVGFEFHSGGSHPVFDGFVVCEEFKDVLLDAWNKEIDESSKRETEKREKRVYGNWKRLIRGLLIREKLKIKYAFGENSGEEMDSKSDAPKVSTLAQSKEKITRLVWCTSSPENERRRQEM